MLLSGALFLKVPVQCRPNDDEQSFNDVSGQIKRVFILQKQNPDIDVSNILSVLSSQDGSHDSSQKADAAARLSTLGQHAPWEVVEALMRVLARDPDPEVRDAAVHALKKVSMPDRQGPILKALIDALKEDPSPKVRKSSALELGKLKPNGNSSILVYITLAQVALEKNEQDAGVRDNAVTALGSFLCKDMNTQRARNTSTGEDFPSCQDGNILAALEQAMLRDSDEKHVRLDAAEALRNIKSRDPSVEEALNRALLSGPNVEVRTRASQALVINGCVNPATSHNLSQALSSEKEPKLRVVIALELGGCKNGGQEVVSVLNYIVSNDPVSEVRAEALNTLNKLGTSDPNALAAYNRLSSLGFKLPERKF